MRVILFRHGIAEARGPGCPPDPQRALTEEGWRKTRKAARGLAAQLSSPLRLISSPYRRAHETATCLLEVLQPRPELEICDELALGADRGGVEAFIESGSHAGDVVLVGHQPDMSSLASQWLVGSDELDVLFKKAAALAIETDVRLGFARAHLLWFLTPRMLRALA